MEAALPVWCFSPRLPWLVVLEQLRRWPLGRTVAPTGPSAWLARRGAQACESAMVAPRPASVPAPSPGSVNRRAWLLGRPDGRASQPRRHLGNRALSSSTRLGESGAEAARIGNRRAAT